MSAHSQRIENYTAYITAIGAPLTRENMTRLAIQNERSGRRINKRRSALAYDQRLAVMNQARVYYALARRASVPTTSGREWEMRNILADTALALPRFGVDVVGDIQGSLVVRRKGGYDFWMVTDNGGELSVVRLNDDDDAAFRSLGYDSWRHGLTDGATLAYRVKRILDGARIDYTVNNADIMAQIVGTDTTSADKSRQEASNG